VHSCGLTTDQEVKCWGSDSYDRIAAPTTGSYIKLDAEQLHSCAVSSENTMVCWGHDEFNRLTPALCF
jgi:hypothetical protein